MSSPSTLSLANKWGSCPPDGYRYVFPDDGFLCHAWTYVDWVDVARKHLSINNKPIPQDLETQMQHQLCMTLPPGFCMYDDDNRPRPNMSLGWGDVAEGLKTFARWLAGGCGYASQAEAERRAKICTRCYLNVDVHGCSGCQQAVKEVTGDKRTKSDQALRSCAVCKCFLKAKVHFPMEALDTQNEKVQQMYPGHCWLNKESENYRAAE